MADPSLMTGLGAALAVALSTAGSAIASASSAAYAVRSKEGIRSFVPVIISGVLGIYGLIIVILLTGKLESSLDTTQGYRHLAAGLAVGLPCLASGFGMSTFMSHCSYPAIAGPTTEPSSTFESSSEPFLTQRVSGSVAPMSIRAMMMLCFLEALGLYGLVAALFLIGK